jgi:uncharacterized DUF497 family protein
MHTFEFDIHKSQSNHEKHGIDFIDAQQLWNDPYLLEVPTRVLGEPRYLVIGIINDKHWSGVITYRDSNIRIISVRRSRKEEVDIYENC